MGLSTHILNTSLGRPIPHVAITLSLFRENATGGLWETVGSGHTDQDGRCKTLLGDTPLAHGNYKMRFETRAYFDEQRVKTLYPYVEIIFTVTDPEQHHHIPLLLTANGYTTYRGS